ncbi:MAG: hypothetical protein IJY31_07450 [Muribaculaceae bacterium]|nr:hypothetical protein [Muribaculaceae bacterium]
MDNFKTLNVPFISGIDSNNLEDIINILDEKGERRTIESLNWAKDFPYHPLTVFTIAHSGKYIYVDFFVRCNYLRAMNYLNNSPVSQDSCVEFFVSPECDAHYWNFEFNCIGTINASHRSERNNPIRLNDDQLALVKRYASCGTRPFNEVEGLFTWNLIIAIPLELIGIHYEGHPIEMKGNFYKCASGSSQPHYLSWNPIHTEKPDFHRPEFFGKIILQ